jgi:hypothetical protein
MWKLVPVCLAAILVVMQLEAQPPSGKSADQGKQAQKDYSDSPIVTKMMAFNKKKDGKLTKEEVTDPRLHRLFDQADANKDGIVTREELMALAAKMDAEFGQGGGGPGGKGGFGGPKGPKGKDGPGGPPRPGQILPSFLQEQLNLSADQKKQLNDLQKQVDTKLASILNEEQRQRLKDMSGPGGFGPGGGFGPPPGKGGFGGGPPKGKGD